MRLPASARALDQTTLDAAVFALLGLALCLPSGYSPGALLLLGLGLWRAPLALRGGLAAESDLLRWGLAAGGMGLAWALHVVEDGQLITNSLGLDRCLKYLLILLALPAFYSQRPSVAAMRWGCWAGAAGAGALALWQVLAQEHPRAFGHTNAIQFGNLALLLGVWSAVWAWQARGRIAPAAQCAGWLAAALGLTASVASASRGGWLALPLLVMLALWRGNALHGLRAAAAAVAASALLLALPPVQERVQLAWHEYQSHSAPESAPSNTSVGLRLSFWRLAVDVGQAHPWLGAGQGGYEQAQSQAVAQGRMHAQAEHFNHAHNEWLDMWAKRGALGLAALALFYALPFALLWRRLRQTMRDNQSDDSPRDDSARQAAALCGLSAVLGFAVFGITQVMFAHNNGNVMYLLAVSLWLAASSPCAPKP